MVLVTQASRKEEKNITKSRVLISHHRPSPLSTCTVSVALYWLGTLLDHLGDMTTHGGSKFLEGYQDLKILSYRPSEGLRHMRHGTFSRVSVVQLPKNWCLGSGYRWGNRFREHDTLYCSLTEYRTICFKLIPTDTRICLACTWLTGGI